MPADGRQVHCCPRRAASWPVLVWLHGGGFTEGGSDLYLPTRLVEKVRGRTGNW